MLELFVYHTIDRPNDRLEQGLQVYGYTKCIIVYSILNTQFWNLTSLLVCVEDCPSQAD